MVDMERLLIFIGALLAAGMLLAALLAPPRPNANEARSATEAPDVDWFLKEVSENPKLVLVDFNATWCGPCRVLAPRLDKLASEYPAQVEILPIDVDDHPDLAQHYQASSIPMVLVMHRGKVLDTIVGAVDYDKLEETVMKHFSHVEPDMVGAAD